MQECFCEHQIITGTLLSLSTAPYPGSIPTQVSSQVVHTVLVWLQVNLATMEMYSPVKGQLRRTHHDGVHVKFAMSERDYSVYAKVGYIQVSNLPFNTFLSVVIYVWLVYLCAGGQPAPFLHLSTSVVSTSSSPNCSLQHW